MILSGASAPPASSNLSDGAIGKKQSDMTYPTILFG